MNPYELQRFVNVAQFRKLFGPFLGPINHAYMYPLFPDEHKTRVRHRRGILPKRTLVKPPITSDLDPSNLWPCWSRPPCRSGGIPWGKPAKRA